MSSNYVIQETIYVGPLSQVRRAIHQPTGERVILKTSAKEYPSARDLARVYHEWQLLSELDSPDIISARELDETGDRPVLVLADSTAADLQALTGAPMTLEVFFRFASRLAAVLELVHRSGLIHRDIKPENILFDADSDTFLLIDFNVSARMADVRSGEEQVDMVAGTLAYMAPEQSGRTSRTIDERADLYGTGVVFYQLLTGRLPFTATQPLELIYQHLTAQPPPMLDLVPDLPASLVAIVARLLAKNPEERYQSARGLLHDLSRAHDAWQNDRTDAEFVAGARDLSDRLHLPHALYGRERVLETLTGARQRAHQGQALLVLISGDPGSGKSSLVDAFERRDIAGTALHATGKCDALQRSVPHKPIIDALQHLLRGILGMSDDEVADWRQRMEAAVAPNGAVLLEVLPDLELIIGTREPLPRVGLVESSNRFRDALRQLVQCLARPGHPLHLFIDDLQWADPATLAVVKALLEDPAAENLLIVGAYRSAELAADSSLLPMADALQSAGVAIERIALANLARHEVAELLADTLRDTREQVAPLAQLVHEKTHGNPFFVRQFITALHRSELLQLDRERLSWTWDVGAIAAADITDNVVELMISRMRELPTAVQELLQRAACLGTRCDLATLAALAPESELAELARLSMAALHAGFLVTTPDVERLLGSLSLRSPAVLTSAEIPAAAFTFLHDRVQQAAYELVPDDAKAQLHLRIGRHLHRHSSAEELERRLFDIVENYRLSSELIPEDERVAVARLAANAAQRARSSNAHDAGVVYARFARSLLPDNAWTEHYEFLREVSLVEVEALSLSGDRTSADAKCRELEEKMRTLDERTRFYDVRVQQHMLLREYDQALALLRHQIGEYGVSFPSSDEESGALIPAELELLFGKLAADPAGVLLAVPTTEERAHEVVTTSLMIAFKVGYLTGKNGLSVLAALRALSYSLEHGFTEYSDYAVCILGFLSMQAFGQPELGIALGNIASELAAGNPSPRARAQTEVGLAALLMHWHQPLHSQIARYDIANELAVNAGDYESISYALTNRAIACFFSGQDLRGFSRRYQQDLVAIKRIQVEITLPFIHGLAFALAQLAQIEIDLLGDDQSIAEGQRHGVRVAIELRVALHIPRPQGEVEALLGEFDRVAADVPGQPHNWESSFSCAMHSIQLSAASEGDARAAHLERANARLEALRGWATHGDANLAHKIELLEAELAAQEETRAIEALQRYEEAMDLAAAAECVHDEALAAERAAAYCQGLRLRHMARQYLARARAAYDRWGASVKVRELDERLGLGAASGTSTGTGGSHSTNALALHALDIETVLRASLAVAQEIRLPRLLTALIEVLMQSAGAERAAVLMTRDDRLAVVAEARPDRGIVVHGASALPVSEWRDGPQSTVRYVQRTRAVEVVGDARNHASHGADPYVNANQVRSLLCMPIEKQGGLIAVVYLENRTVTDSFTYSQVALLGLLAGQIATSLENARLYAELEKAMSDLESNERLKLEFLARVSHELRTPLNAVVNLPDVMLGALPENDDTAEKLDALLDSMSVTDMRDMLETVRAGGEQLLSEIEQMILFSRLEAGIQRFEPTSVSLERVIAQASSNLARAAAERGIEVTIDGPAAEVSGDARLLGVVVGNLLENAIKFSPEGAVVSVRTVVAEHGVELSVADCGRGISEEQQAFIFESFRQGSEGTKRAHGGTGLGLAVTKKLVDLHDGTIAVESRPRHGSTFTLRLPSAR